METINWSYFVQVVSFCLVGFLLFAFGWLGIVPGLALISLGLATAIEPKQDDEKRKV